MQVSCTADATSDVVGRVSKVLTQSSQKSDSARLERLKGVQKKIDMLKKRGLLNRQEYSEAKSSDFQKMFLKND